MTATCYFTVLLLAAKETKTPNSSFSPAGGNPEPVTVMMTNTFELRNSNAGTNR